MEVVAMVIHILTVAVLGQVTHAVAYSLSCELLYVKSVAFACNKYLSQIQIEVLAGHYGHYNRVCSAFDEYVQCLEPNLGYCKKEQYSTTREYFTEKAKFSSAPYNCTVPPAVYTFKGVKQEVTKDKMPSDSQHNLAPSCSSNFFAITIATILTFLTIGSVT